MDSIPLVERTVFKVAAPLRIERICFRFDFHVPPDFDVGRIDQPQPSRLSVRGSVFSFGREISTPVAGIGLWPVSKSAPEPALFFNVRLLLLPTIS